MVPIWDPFSENPFRLLGVARNHPLPTLPDQVRPFSCPGLEAIELDLDRFEKARASLLDPAQAELARATWFDASRPLDEACYADVLEGRMQEAWQRWECDPGPISLHNLAVMAHLRSLYLKEDWTQAYNCAQRWISLAYLEPVYGRVIEHWLEWLKNEIHQALTRGDAQALRCCWTVAQWFLEPAIVESEQKVVLADEFRRWDFELAGLRTALLEDVEVARVAQRLEEKARPLANFLLDSLPEESPLARNLRLDLARFFVSLARAWKRQPKASEATLSAAEAALEEALKFADSELALEIRPELERWRLERQPRVATPVQVTLEPAKEFPLKSWLGAAILALVLMGLVWASKRHSSAPVIVGMTRPVAEKRVEQILEEISPLAADLKDLTIQITYCPDPEVRGRLQNQHTELKKKHEVLKEELIRLQRWLESR